MESGVLYVRNAANTDWVIAVGGIGAQGNQGYQGPTGAPGTPGGPQGYQGYQGATGVQGAQGTQGVRGYQGYQGYQGQTGTQGATGSQGYQGYQGYQGHTGSQGVQGYQGYQGRSGTAGPQGYQGAPGAGSGSGGGHVIEDEGTPLTQRANLDFQGQNVWVFDDGVDTTQVIISGGGATGPQGYQGPTGATGPQGYQGHTGVGYQGYQGTTGAQGYQGYQGYQGHTGVGYQGYQGYQGATGVSVGGGHTIQDEGTPETQRTNLNFAGTSVWVEDDVGNDATKIIISGGGAQGPQGYQGYQGADGGGATVTGTPYFIPKYDSSGNDLENSNAYQDTSGTIHVSGSMIIGFPEAEHYIYQPPRIHPSLKVNSTLWGFSHVSVNPASGTYYRIAYLPKSTLSTYDHIVIDAFLDDAWSYNTKSLAHILMGNRNGFDYDYELYGNRRYKVRILAIQQPWTDDLPSGTTSIYVFHSGSSYTSISYNITHSVQATIFQNPEIFVYPPPSGTIVFDSAVNTPRYMIDADGDVGINTFNPQYKLHVSGSVGIEGQVTIKGGSPGVNKFLKSDAGGLATWDYVTGTPGPQGYQGYTGAQGPQGYQGAAGGGGVVTGTPYRISMFDGSGANITNTPLSVSGSDTYLNGNRLYFGSGTDVTLYRQDDNILLTESNFFAFGYILTDDSIFICRTEDKLYFGDSSGAYTVNLYRTADGHLITDNRMAGQPAVNNDEFMTLGQYTGSQGPQGYQGDPGAGANVTGTPFFVPRFTGDGSGLQNSRIYQTGSSTIITGTVIARGTIYGGEGLAVGFITGTPSTGDALINADVRVGGGMVVGSTRFNPASTQFELYSGTSMRIQNGSIIVAGGIVSGPDDVVPVPGRIHLSEAGLVEFGTGTPAWLGKYNDAVFEFHVPVLNPTGDIKFLSDTGTIGFGVANDVNLFRGWANLLSTDDGFSALALAARTDTSISGTLTIPYSVQGASGGGTGTVKMNGATNRNSTGWMKIYVDGVAKYIPYWDAVTG